jgi:hypothetical protein
MSFIDKEQFMATVHRLDALKGQPLPSTFEGLKEKFPAHSHFFALVEQMEPGEYHSYYFHSLLKHKLKEGYDPYEDAFAFALLHMTGLLQRRWGLSWRGIQRPERWDDVKAIPKTVDGRDVDDYQLEGYYIVPERK